VLLAVLAFSLSLLGTFLVRSGVLTSVHAFAQDPARGMFILGFLLVVTGGGLALYAWRAPKLESGGLYQPISREGALILNNLLLCTLAATVLLGTLYPLFLDLITGAKVSVGPPFFNATFVPISLALFAALCVGPYLGWKRAELWPALVRLRAAFAVAVIAAIVAAVAIDGRATLAALCLGFGVWLIAGSLLECYQRLARTNWRLPPRAAIGMTIAHTALGFVVLGAVATAAWHLELIQTMKPGDSVRFAGFEISLKQVQPLNGPNYVAERATLAVTSDGGPYTTLTPERRLFTLQQRQVAETSIHTNLLRDLYATLGEGDAQKGWVIRLYYNPLAPWIWLGAALCALGGFVSLSDRRLRVGAPRGSKGRSRAAAQPAE
jgi:cytochrome c-type biogenesis protein CcmF